MVVYDDSRSWKARSGPRDARNPLPCPQSYWIIVLGITSVRRFNHTTIVVTSSGIE